MQEHHQKSIKYFEKGADNGDWQSMFQLGVIHYDGLAGTVDQVRLDTVCGSIFISKMMCEQPMYRSRSASKHTRTQWRST